jgi:hypothetical protein
MTPDRSVEHAAYLHVLLRSWLLATMPYEAPEAIAGALMYEAVSIAAAGARTEAEAHMLIRRWLHVAIDQIDRLGVGQPHP